MKDMAAELRQEEEYRIAEEEESKTQRVAKTKQGNGDSLAEGLDSVLLEAVENLEEEKKEEEKKEEDDPMEDKEDEDEEDGRRMILWSIRKMKMRRKEVSETRPTTQLEPNVEPQHSES